jgi:hypothetical protein
MLNVIIFVFIHIHLEFVSAYCCCMTTIVVLGLIVAEVSRLHSDTPHSVGLLWTSDRPAARLSQLKALLLQAV